jgi:hypothetical protein
VDIGLERYEPVLQIIDGLKRRDFAGDKLVPSVKRLKRQISKAYGGREVLSATTKFLWLKLQSPSIIYDSQARSAVGTPDGDYAKYCSRWQEMFIANRSRIEAACRSLVRVRKFTCDVELATKEYIAEHSKKRWFHERVFDSDGDLGSYPVKRHFSVLVTVQLLRFIVWRLEPIGLWRDEAVKRR